MSQLQDFAGWIIGGLGAALGGLAGLVRAGDMQRIKAIEQRQEQQERSSEAGRDKLYAEIKELRKDVDQKHGQLVNLITERRT